METRQTITSVVIGVNTEVKCDFRLMVDSTTGGLLVTMYCMVYLYTYVPSVLGESFCLKNPFFLSSC